ncbi:ABC transporter permease [Alphaproteobacteria bacterium]|nr:ABC transporter permease [Alphaproteobacteria bacterium]
MFVVLIAVYTTQELSTDAFQEKADRIYLLANTGGADENFSAFYGTAFRLADRIAGRYPEIEKVCPVAYPFGGGAKSSVTIGDVPLKASLMFADTTFFEVFSYPLMEGEASQVLLGKNNAVVSETFAHKAFPGADPVGQRIDLGNSLVVTVSGVMKDIKNSVILPADILVRIDNVGQFNSIMDDGESFSNAGSALIFILAKEGANLQAKAEDMSAFFKEIFWLYKRGIFTQVNFTPLRDVYFSDIQNSGMLEQGNRMFVLILLSVGGLILLFAVINYINLTTAQAGFRAKEMATRRLLGSGRGELFLRFILEATVLSLASFVLGLFLAFACETYAGNLLEKPLDIAALISPVSVLACILLVAGLGILAGLIPATIMSNAKPIDVMKGSLRTKNKMVFSRVFITFQNCITIALIAASITMVWQVNHLINAPLGYRTDNIIEAALPGEINNRQKMNTLVNELRNIPLVRQTSLCWGTPFNRGNNNTLQYEGRNISMQNLVGDSAYFKMLGLKILRDNGLQPGEGYYLTQYSFKEFNVPEDVEAIHISADWKIPVAGVVKDFQLRDITHPRQPVCLSVREFDFEKVYPWDLLVEVQGDPVAGYRAVKETWERVTRLDFDGQFIDRKVAESFASLQRTATIVTVFGGIAILISLLGLLAMSTYFVQQRSREIAVRKVFGSDNSGILRQLVGTFLLYVLFAFLIVTPIVWYIMRQWLSGYSYRIPLSPLIFLAAGMFCLLVSFLTIFRQSYQAANANPVKSLQNN